MLCFYIVNTSFNHFQYVLYFRRFRSRQVQLFNYLHPARYPVHALAPGAQNVEVVMDCAGGGRSRKHVDGSLLANPHDI